MRRILLGSIAALVLSASAHALTYSEVIPAGGPAVLPGPVVAGQPSTPLRMQVVDHEGLVDEVFVEYGQNWGCLGPDLTIGMAALQAQLNNADNYPVVSIYDVGNIYNLDAEYTKTIHGYDINLSNYTPIATINIAKPDDYPSCANETSCHNLYTAMIPQSWATVVKSGDLLVWGVDRGGVNCMGLYYFQHQLNWQYPQGDNDARYPAAPGGELTISVHVYEGNNCVAYHCDNYPGPSGY